MTDVFISYRRSERDRCELIANRLRELGLTVWFDAELEGGQHFPDVIDEKVHEAKAVVVLWSKAATASQWVKAEASIGLADGKLVSATLEHVRLPVPFNNIHTVDLTSWDGDAGSYQWMQLVRPIERLVGRKIRPDEPPRAPHAPRPSMSPEHPEPVERFASSPVSRRTIMMAGGAAGVVALAAAGWMLWPRQDAAQSSETLQNVLDEISVELLRESPEYATALGASEEQAGGRYIDRLSDASREGLRRSAGVAERALARLRQVSRSGLAGQDAVTYDVVLAAMESNVECSRFESGAGAQAPYTVTQLTGAYANIPDFLASQHPLTNSDEADAYLARLSQYARVLDQESARIGEDAADGVIPPDFAIAGAINQLTAFSGRASAQTVLVQSLQSRLSGIAEMAPADKAAFVQRADVIVRDEVLPAYRRQIAALTATLPRATHDAGVWRLARGEERYRAGLKAYTTTSLSPDEIHNMGVELVSGFNSEIDAILRGQGMTRGTVAERIRAIGQRPDQRYPSTDAGRDQLIADLTAQLQTIRARMPEVFGRLARGDLEIRRVPAFVEAGSPGGYYQPAALDGSRPGAYYINLRDPANEWPKFMLPTLTYHEGVPGHHWQISIQQEAGELPFIRSALLGFGAYAEGWGLYAEQLADEMGMYANDPFGRVGYLQSAAFRASRLVVDTGMHAKRWTREQAIDSMLAATGDNRSSVVTEIDRYCVWPGQACSYMVGRQAINRMRESARQTLGDRFDIRGFHDTLLTNGATPLSVSEQLVQRWVEQAQAA